MTETMPGLLELTEYVPATYGRDRLSLEAALELRNEYGKQVQLDAPDLFTDTWKLTSQGWIGYIPLSDGTSLLIQPKIALSNLFRMLEYAYDTPFRILEGSMECQSLQEFYERLAHILAKRVLARARRGLYRAYIPEDDRLPYVRGRVDMKKALQSPGMPTCCVTTKSTRAISRITRFLRGRCGASPERDFAGTKYYPASGAPTGFCTRARPSTVSRRITASAASTIA